MNETMKIVFAGDTFPVPKNYELFSAGKTKELFGERICELFQTADYSVCNLEGCLTDTGEAVEKIGPSVKAPTATLRALSEIGLKAATLANTHTLDFGETGHNEMRAALEANHIEHFGTGDSIEEIKTHVTVERKGRRVILYTVTELFPFNTPGKRRHGANGYDEYAVCRELSALKQSCDFLVVLYHGGAEMTHYNTKLIRKRFHRMADNGADIIISQHTHAVGFEEHYNGAYLLYGQGNFCFNLSPHVSELNATGILLEVDFGSEGFSVKKHLVKRTALGCEYDGEQDFSAFEERTKRHDRLLAGDEEAEAEFDRQFSAYCSSFWLPRLLGVFRGINPDDDKALEGRSGEEAADYLTSRYTKRQLMAIRMMLQNDEFNEIAAAFIAGAIENKD